MGIIHEIRQAKVISKKTLVHKPPGRLLVLLLEIEWVVVGAAGVKRGLAHRAGIITTQILCDTQRTMAVAAVHGGLPKLLTRPHGSGVVSGLVVALDAGVERGATRVFDSDNIALGVIMCALGTRIDFSSVNGRLVRHQDSKRSTCSTPLTLDRR